ncbi:MAG: DMT family protein [Desulfovibrio sp.]|nr:DMT family protein [Desulfovibrio sp.]
MFAGALPVPVQTIGLLLCSNIFMTFAWYGHLRWKGLPILLVILSSWGLAFFEYLLQVPANRIGFGYFSAVELKTIQEVISLTVFMGFSIFWLGERIHLNHIIGFALIVLASWIIFRKA